MSDPAPRLPRILTPDQRLRVFVSSTLQELADERRAAKAAIERLRLAPVLFELGARPHPPRALYRAYLEQSQVFLGIYWQRYGWIAPGEDVSGLEDEYDLAGARPKLIYVKGPAPEREGRLDALLERIRDDDRASYRPFESAAELRELIENDLALLLTERFAATPVAPAGPVAPEPPRPTRLPVASTPLVGRQEGIDEIVGLLLGPEARLVTLTGPGGIGKTRLALAVAERLREAFEDGVFFVPLAAVRDPDRVADATAQALGLKVEGGAPALETLKAYLRDRDALLVLDNLEQVSGAGPALAELLRAAPRLRLLATSRVALRLSAEQVHPVAPLALPEAGEVGGEAMELFLDRARAVRGDVPTDDPSLRAVAEIVRRLDGLPLAIELAAARSRLLSPQGLLARLERRLDLLTSGPRDLPGRQRTLRATLDWSYELLGPHERRLFARLGTFVGGFTLEAALALGAREDEEDAPDPLDLLDRLVDHSLVRVAGGDGGTRFALLETVREYAVEKLEEGVGGDPEEARARHAAYFLDLAERLGPRLKVAQAHGLAALVAERANVRAAIEWALRRGRADAVVRMGWALWLYWWIRNEQEEALPWMEAALRAPLGERERGLARTVTGALLIRRGDALRARELFEELVPRVRAWREPATEAHVLIGAGLAALASRDYGTAARDFAEARDLFRDLGDAWGTAFVHAALARVALAQGDAGRAVALTEPLVAPTLAAGDQNTAAWILHVQGVAETALGRPAAASAHLGHSLDLFARLGNLAGTGHVIGSLAALALAVGDADTAVRLGGAAEALGEAVGALPFEPERSRFLAAFAEARERVGERGAELEAEGRRLGASEALALARASLDPLARGRPAR